MSIFRRDDRPPASRVEVRREPPPPPPRQEHQGGTTVGRGLVVQGLLTGSGRVEIEGRVEGEVRVDGVVVVRPGGRVRGTVSAREVRIEGSVRGDVEGLDRAEVGDTGNVQGDIEAPRVVIAEGAFFKGKVKMGGAPKAGRGTGAAVRERS